MNILLNAQVKVQEVLKSDYGINYRVYDKEELMCTFVLDFCTYRDAICLEHINKVTKSKDYKVLPTVIDWVFKNHQNKQLIAMPLIQHRNYFEKLGFVVYDKSWGEDIYYVLKRDKWEELNK